MLHFQSNTTEFILNFLLSKFVTCLQVSALPTIIHSVFISLIFIQSFLL